MYNYIFSCFEVQESPNIQLGLSCGTALACCSLWRIACARRTATMGRPYKSNHHNPDQSISQSQHFEFGAAVALVLFFGAGLFYYQLRFAVSFGGDALGLDSF